MGDAEESAEDGPGGKRSMLRRVLLRSFLLQGSWNFERMQGLGWCYALFPALREHYKGDEELRRAVIRHLGYFNTQPYMASFVLGAVARLEEEVAAGRMSGAEIEELKKGLMGPLGALGDSFFWAGIRPAASVVSVVLFLAGMLWAPLIFLVLFNVPHLWFRWAALKDGYYHGVRVVEVMMRYDFQRKIHHLKLVSLALSGMAPAIAWGMPGTEPPASRLLWPLLLLACTGIMWLIARRGIPASRIVVGAGLLCVFFSIMVK